MNISEISQKLEDGVSQLLNSENYRQYLTVMSKFTNYSYNNQLLIYLQKPNATLLAGYKAWQTKFKRHVRAGEKAIQILAPIIIKNDDGEMEIKAFKVTNVFDISQTEGEPLPSIMIDELKDDVKDFRSLIDILIQVAKMPVLYQKLDFGVKGYFSKLERCIVLNLGMSESQLLKTLIHEIAHSRMHAAGNTKSRRDKEVEAESVAYIVCQYLRIDTSDYSFGYLASWSDSGIDSIKKSLNLIQRTSQELIKEIISRRETDEQTNSSDTNV